MTPPIARPSFDDLRAGFLLDLMATGDQEAFGDLYDCIGAAIFAHHVAAGPGRGSAERLTASTLLQIWVHAPRFPSSNERATEWMAGFLRPTR